MIKRARFGLWLFFTMAVIAGCNEVREDQDPANAALADDLSLAPFFDAVSAFPDSLPLYEQLIDTLANRGRYAEAAVWCDSVLARQESPSLAWLFIKGDLYRIAKVPDSAISAYRRYLAYFPDDEQILLNLASTLAEKGDPESVKLCRQIGVQFPTRATLAHTAYITGIYYNVIKEYARARPWFDSAIARQYNFNEAWMERGYGLYDEGKYKDAQRNFKQLTEISSSYAEGWYWLGKSAEALKNKEDAIKYYSRAYSLDRNITEARRAIERLKK